MKKLIAVLMVVLLCSPIFAVEYKLGPYDTLELEVVNHPELKTKQTLTPDGQASLPLLGVIPIEGQTLQILQQTLTEKYAAYLKNPQLTINLTPKPIYIVQYDLNKDVWEVKAAKSVDEAQAFAGLDPTLSIEHGKVYKVTMSKKPDWWESNWYKVITATAVLVGIYSSFF